MSVKDPVDTMASVMEYTGIDEDDDVVTETPSLSFVWGVFKESGTAAKLILPDLLSRPFYLPSPRATKAEKDAKFERDLRRLDFICQRDSQYSAPSDRRNILNLIPDYGLRGKERVIEKRLVDPYREDSNKRAIFLREMMEKEDKLEPAKKPAAPPRSPEPISRPTVVQREMRRTLVVQRHATLLETEQGSLVEYAQKMEDKRQKVQESLEQLAQQQAGYKHTKWLQILAALRALRIIHASVCVTRRQKAVNPELWKACIRIQKWFRNIVFFKLKKNIKGCRPNIRVNNVVKLLREAAIKAGNERTLYSQRQLACTVITKFLYELQGRMSVYVRKFISKIKNLQYYLKRHFVFNALRIALVERLVEALLPTLLLHVDLVHQGRGHDLKNLTSYDLNKLSSVDRLTARFHLVTKMNTPAFHAHLRTQYAVLPVVLAVFKPHGGRTSRNMVHGKDEVFDLLQRKRKVHQINLARQKIVQLKIPMFHTGHVKTFIHGGEDPLHSFLLDAQKQQTMKHEAQQAARKSRTGRALDQNGSLMLLTSIDTEDLTFLVMSVAAKLADNRGQKGRGSAGHSVAAAEAVSAVSLMSGEEHRGVHGDGQALGGEVRVSSGDGRHSGSGEMLSTGLARPPARPMKVPKVPGKGSTGPSKSHSSGLRPATPPRVAHSKADSPQKARRVSTRVAVPPGSPV